LGESNKGKTASAAAPFLIFKLTRRKSMFDFLKYAAFLFLFKRGVCGAD
jgi:hypothetical protein